MVLAAVVTVAGVQASHRRPAGAAPPACADRCAGDRRGIVHRLKSKNIPHCGG